VLNVAHSGHGRGHNRLRHLVMRAQGQPPDRWPTPPGGPILAELSGMFGTALNLRRPGVGHEIDYPFTTSGRPDSELISLSELVVRHDGEADLVRLWSTRRDAEVVPLHLGMMADILLPPVARLLTQCFSPAYFVHPSMSLLAEEADLADMPESIVRYHRVMVGRVVVRRARWLVPAALMPVREPHDTDAGFLLRLVEWLSANGLPTRCFVRVWPDDLWGGGGARIDRWVLEKAHKPVFVDFANWYLVMAFERMLGGSVVVFEEALPTADEGLQLEGDPRVSEFLIEISEGAGGDG
jgi:hypothetical protein